MNKWISFEEIKARVSIEDILNHYGIDLRRRKDELIGICPFHEETKGSFSANVTKNIWQCFGCKRSGNLFDFVINMDDAENVREAALRIAEWFPGSSDSTPTRPTKSQQVKEIPIPGAEENGWNRTKVRKVS